MNEWIRKSIILATQQNYLDRIQDIYPAGEISERELPANLVQEIVNAHTNRQIKELIIALMKLEKFPIQDPRVAFLRKGERAIDRNSETVNSLGQGLLNIPIDELLKLCKQGKATNTKMGNMFRSWLRSLPYPQLNQEDFQQLNEIRAIEGETQKILIMDGTPLQWKNFADTILSCGLYKEPDLMCKVNGHYIIGEAKWLGDFGGNQNNHFAEAIDFVHSTQGNATRIAVLDGVVWLDTNNRMNREIRRVEAIAMSALLLKDYFESLLD
jgi:hypothetical protein